MSNPETVPNVTSLPEQETPKKSRIRNFMDNHPRATRAAGITAAVATVAVVVAAVKSRRNSDTEDSLEHAEDELTLDTTESAA